MKPFSSEEFRLNRPGIKLTATEAGVIAHWGELERTLTPVQARILALQLHEVADKAEECGAKEWFTE